MERNSAPGWRHGDESYRRKLHSRRGNDDDAKTKGACDFLLPIQTSLKDGVDWWWLIVVFNKKKSQGFIALDPQSHNFFSRLFACVFCFLLSCTMRCNLAVPLDFPVSYFLFFSFLFAQIWQPWRRNTCRIICAIFRLTNDDETWSRSKSRPISDCSAVASNE